MSLGGFEALFTADERHYGLFELTVGVCLLGCALWRSYKSGGVQAFISRKRKHFRTILLVGLGLAGGLLLTAPFLKTLYIDLEAKYFDHSMKRIRAFSLVMDRDPALQQRLTSLEDMIRRDEIQPARAAAAFAKDLVPDYQSYVAITSDDAIREYTTAYVETLETLYRVRPEVCQDFINNTGARPALSSLEHEHKRRLFDAMARVVDDAITSPQFGGSIIESEQRLSRVLASIGIAGGQTELYRIAHGSDPQKACTTMEEVFVAILPLPARDAGLILRSMFSGRMYARPLPPGHD